MFQDRRAPIPQLQAETFGEKKALFLRVFSYVRPYRKRLVVGLLCTVVASWFHVAGVGLLKPTLEVIFGEEESIDAYSEPRDQEGEARDSLLGGLRNWLDEHIVAPLYRKVLIPLQERPLLALLCVGVVLVGMVAGKGLFSYAQSYLTKWVIHRIAVDLRVRVYEHLNRLSLDYITSKGTGRLMAHVTSDIDLFATNVDVFGDTLIQPFTILSVLTVLFFMNPQMTLVALVTIPIVGYTLQVMGRKARRASRQRQEHVAGLSGILQETFSAGRVVRAFSMEEYEEQRLGVEALRVFRNSMKIVRARSLAPALTETLGAVAVLLVLVGGYFLALRSGGMTPAAFMSYLALVFALYAPIRRLSRVSITINNALAGAERVFSVLDTPPQVTDGSDAEELPPFSDSIEYQNVSFEYQPGVPALADVSTRIRKGGTVALVGHSGAGKTTFVDLLARFYDVTSGAILVDGRDIRKVKVQSLRRQIGIVPQEVALFNDTVRNNIAYGRPDLDLEIVRQAAREANAHEFIEAFPEGYDTIIGERGHALSGGECQRISIARALVKNPPILIFDEATSSLDSESEIQIRKAMEKLMRNRTTFVIAHRLSTVIHADRILVLERGRIVGEGKHEELLRTNALYQRLYALQFGATESNE